MEGAFETEVSSFRQVASNEIAKGFYPTDRKDVSLIAQTLKFRYRSSRGHGCNQLTLNIFDPCAGEGQFLAAMKRRIQGMYREYTQSNANGYYYYDIRTYGVELDAQRYNKLRGCHQTVNASYFDVDMKGEQQLILLNPPYNKRDNKLLKWIDTAAKQLHYSGKMVLIIPEYEMQREEIREYIDNNFSYIYVFKSSNHEQYKQMVIFLGNGGSVNRQDSSYRNRYVSNNSNWDSEAYPCLSTIEEGHHFECQIDAVDETPPLLSAKELQPFYERCKQAVSNLSQSLLVNSYPQDYDKNITPLATLRTAHAIQLAAMNSQIESVSINGTPYLAKYMLVNKLDRSTNAEIQEETTIERPVVEARLMDSSGALFSLKDLSLPYLEINTQLSAILLNKLSIQFAPRHEFGNDPDFLKEELDQIGLMAPQKEAVKALMKGYQAGIKSLGIRANTGTGKAFVLKAIAILLKSKRTFVVTEPHLVPQLVEEYENEDFDVHVIDSWAKAKEVAITKPEGMYLLAYSQIRMHPKFVSCAVEKQHRERDEQGNIKKTTTWSCPSCWQTVSTKRLPKSTKKKCPHCNSPLYTYVPEQVKERYRFRQWSRAVTNGNCVEHRSMNSQLPYIRPLSKIPFDFAGFDEIHNASNSMSNQGSAFLKIISRVPRSLCLTATLTNGIASSLYNVLWGMIPERMAQDGWDRTTTVAFQKRYGAFKTIKKTDGEGNRHRQGQKTRTFDSSGISPAVLKYTLGIFVNMDSKDFTDMPPVERYCVKCEPHPNFGEGIQKISNIISDANLQGCDRLAAVSVKNNAILRLSDTYHHFNDTLMLRDKFLGTLERDPISKLSEKEQKIVEVLLEAKSRGERVLLYTGITQKIDIRPVLQKIIRRYTQSCVDSLPDTVPARKVVGWFKKSTDDVTIASYKRVGTGLNLSQYTYVIWFDYTNESRRAEQGDGRVRRVNTCKIHRQMFGEVRPIKYYYFTSSIFREAQLSYTLEKRMVSSLIEGEIPEIDPATTSGGENSFSSIMTIALQGGTLNYADPSSLLRSMTQEENARVDSQNICETVTMKPSDYEVLSEFAPEEVDAETSDQFVPLPLPEVAAPMIQMALF